MAGYSAAHHNCDMVANKRCRSHRPESFRNTLFSVSNIKHHSMDFIFDTYKNTSQVLLNYSKTLLVNKLPINVVIQSELVISFIKFAIPLLFILTYFLFTGVDFGLGVVLFIPVYICLILFGATIGLIISLLISVSRDFVFIADNVMRVLMFISPVIYSSKVSVGMLDKILKINPLTYLFDGIRSLFFYGNIDNYKPLLICCALIAFLFVVVARFFIVNTPRILERAEI